MTIKIRKHPEFHHRQAFAIYKVLSFTSAEYYIGYYYVNTGEYEVDSFQRLDGNKLDIDDFNAYLQDYVDMGEEEYKEFITNFVNSINGKDKPKN